MLWIVLLVPIAVLLAVVPMLLYTAYASRNAQFEVDLSGLVIRGSLYGRTIPREALLVQEARIVNLNAEQALQPELRTNGTSVPGFREGWFRLVDGRKALVFVTADREAVYVPTTEGYVVLVSPMKPEVFLATLQRGTSVPVTFQIAPSSSKAQVWLLAAGLLPLLLAGLVIWPIVRVALRQRRPFLGPVDPSVLYADRLVEITDDSILLRDYYFPIGSKRVRSDQIEYIRARPLTLWTGAWRIWGTGDFITWFPADWNRPTRDTGFLLVRKAKTIRIGFTVEDSAAVKEILRRKGLLRED